MKNKALNERLMVLKSENIKLKSQVNYAEMHVNKLLDENKDMEIRINELKEEKELLQRKTIDPSNFVNWDHEDILSWIVSIDGGYFDKYRSILSKELNDCNLRGSDLSALNSADIRGLGVKVFHDAKKLERHIQQLIQKYDKSVSMEHNANIITTFTEEGADTAYL